MIALIVGNGKPGNEPLTLAFAHAGFEPRGIASAEDAAGVLAACGAMACVLVAETRFLEQPANRSGWARLLTRHPELAAVFVARGPARSAVVAPARHRVLLEDPFDAAAVVAAARRACSGGPLRRGDVSALRLAR